MEKFNQFHSREKRKNSAEVMVEQLEPLLLKMSDDINDDIRQYLPEEIRNGDLLDKNGVVREEMYSSEYGGPIEPKQIENYNQFVS